MKLPFGITLLGLVIFTLCCCDLNTPNDPVRDSSADGRNPDANPTVQSFVVGTGSGYSNNPVQVHLNTSAASEVQIGSVPNQGSLPTADWQPMDTLYSFNVSGEDGERWLACQVKALNGRINGVYYENYILDTHCAVDTFYWTSAAGDTLFMGDTLTIHLAMVNDVIGAETGGAASVNLVTFLTNFPLYGVGSGNYSGTYVVQPGDWLENGALVLNFTDRGGNTPPLTIASKLISLYSNMNPQEVGYYDISSARNVVISGNYAYVAAEYSGLRIINVSNPANPYEAGYYSDYYFTAMTVSGSFVYIPDSYSYVLRIINVSNPANPFEVGNCNLPDYPYEVAVSGSYAYVADGGYGLRIIDVSNPTSPFEVGYLSTGFYAQYIAVLGNHAYVTDGGSSLRIINVSNPTSPSEVGSCEIYNSNIYDVTISGNYFYVADNSYADLHIIDVSNPESPFEVGNYDTPGNAYSVAVAGKYAYVADYESGLRIIDVSNPSNPFEAGYYDTPGSAYGVAVLGNYVYVADGWSGLRIISLWGEP